MNDCNIKYIGDKMEFCKMPGGIMAMDIFVLINYSLRNECPDAYKKNLRLAGREHFKPIIKNYVNKKNIGKIKILKSLLEQIKTLGLGDVKLLVINKHKFIINLYKGTFPNQYKKLFGIQKEGVDHFMCGIMEEIFDSVFNKKSQVIEKLCIAQGKKNCIFEIVI